MAKKQVEAVKVVQKPDAEPVPAEIIAQSIVSIDAWNEGHEFIRPKAQCNSYSRRQIVWTAAICRSESYRIA